MLMPDAAAGSVPEEFMPVVLASGVFGLAVLG
jgi:hypothetical protein